MHALLLLVLLGAWASAGPIGEQIVRGDVTFSRQGDLTLIRASNNSIVNYRAFDIAGNETVRFLQPDASSRVLNRITSAMPTRIDGALLANGQVYLINPAGVYFGKGCFIDVAGIHAAAAHLSDQDFLHGIDRFVNAQGSVVNLGTIRADSVTLFGRQVANYGSIVADKGMVILAAGDDVLLGERDGHVFAKIEGGAANGPAVENAGSVKAEGGTVMFGAGDMYSLAILNTGAVKANDIRVEGGAKGVVQVGGSIDASSSTGQGGSVAVTGEKVALAGATIDASGATGGGSILIGGDYQGKGALRNAAQTYVSAGTTLSASGLVSGSGGRVIVWSDEATGVYGTIRARGGTLSGDGGFVETSSKGRLVAAGRVDLGAPSGQGGTWLLDPNNILIDGANQNISAGPNFVSTGEPSVLSIATLLGALSGGATVTVTTASAPPNTQNGDITLASPLDFNGTGTNSLTLNASRHININAAISDGTPGGDVLNLALNPGAAGTLTLAAPISLGTGTLSGTANTVLVNSPGLIQNAIDAAASGATINVVAATYNEALAINKPLTLIGKHADGTTDAWAVGTAGTDGSGPTIGFGGNAHMVNFAADNITLRGFVIDTTGGGTRAIYFEPAGGTVASPTIEYCDFALAAGARGVSIDDGYSVTTLALRYCVFDGPADGNSNWFTVGSGTAAVGDGGSIDGATLQYNTITESTSQLRLDGTVKDVTYDGNTFNQTVGGILLYEPDEQSANQYQNIQITGNTFNNGTLDEFAVLLLGVDDADIANWNTDLVIYNNSILQTGADSFDKVGFAEGGHAVTINASCNWWGTTTEANIQNRVTASRVDYTPWQSAANTFTTLYVSASSPQSGATGRINEAIGLLTAGGTINILTGTYAENVSITKALTLSTSGGAATATSWATDASNPTVGLAGDFVASGAGGVNFTGNVTLAGNVATSGGTFQVNGATTITGSVEIDTTNGGASAAGGPVQFGGNVNALNTSAVHALTITTNGSASDGAVSLANVGNTTPLGALSITADTGTITLNGSQVRTTRAGGGTGNMTFGSTVVLTADTAFTTGGGVFNAAAADFSSDANGPWNMSVDTTGGSGGVAGNVLLYNFTNSGVTYVSGVNINANETTTDGLLELNGALTLDNHVTSGAAADFAFAGGDVLVKANITADTNADNAGASGTFNLGTSRVYGNGGAYSLTLNTNSTGAAAGAVTLGLVDNGGGSGGNAYLSKLDISALGTPNGAINLRDNVTVHGTGTANDAIVLSGATVIDNSSITDLSALGTGAGAGIVRIAGTVTGGAGASLRAYHGSGGSLQLNAAITTGGYVNFYTGVSTLTLLGNSSIDTSSSGSGNLLVFGVTGNYTLTLTGGTNAITIGGADVDTLTLASGGTLTLSGIIEADTALDFTNVGEITLNADTQILARDSDAANAPQHITFDSGNTISGAYALTIDGNNVTLYQVGKTSSRLTNLNATAAGVLSLNDDIYLATGGTATLGGTIAPGGTGSVFGKVTIEGNLVFASSSTLDIDISGASTFDQLEVKNGNAGTLDFGVASISGSMIGGYTPGVGVEFCIIDNDFSDDKVTNYGPSTVTLSGQIFSVLYNKGTGNSVYLHKLSGVWTWNGDSATTDNWSDGDNWVADTPPVDGAGLVFAGSNRQVNNNNFSGATYATLTFSNGGFTLGGNAISLSSGITNTAGTNTISLPITVAGDQTFAVTAGAGVLNINGAVTLNGPLNLTGGGAIVFGGAVDGAQNLNINLSGTTATATFNGAVGNGTELPSIVVQNSKGVTFTNIVKAQTVDLQDTTGTIAFQGDTTISTGLTTAAQGYNVAFTGTTSSVAGDTSFLNTGAATLGNGVGDSTTFVGGLDTTGGPSGTSIAGTVATTNTQMDLGATSMTAAATLTSGSGGINVASLTDGGGGFTLSLQDNTPASTGTTTFLGNVAIGSFATFARPYNVVFQGTTNLIANATTFQNGGTLTFGDANGDSSTFTSGLDTTAVAGGTLLRGTLATTNTPMALGATTLSGNATLKSGSGAVSVASLTDGASSFTLSLQENTLGFTGAVTFLGDVAVNTLTTFARPYAVAFQGTNTLIDTDTNFANTGGLTLGNGDLDVVAFTGGLGTGTNAVTGRGTVQTDGQQMDVGATGGLSVSGGTLTLATNNNVAAGATLNVGAVTGGGNNLTLNGGTGGAVTVASVAAGGTLTLTNAGSFTFTGDVTTNTLTTTASGYTAAFNGGGTITTDTNFANTGGLTLGDGDADVLTFVGGLGTGSNAVTGRGTARTNGQQMDIGATGGLSVSGGTLTLATNNTVAAGATLNVGAVAGGGNNLTLNGGTAGAVTVASLASGGTLTLTNAGSFTFTGNVTTNTLATAANGYPVAFNGGGTITTDTNFLNTGSLTLGNDALDVTTFTGGLDTTAGPSGTNVAGTVATTNAQMDLGATTLGANATVKSGSGAINLASATDGASSYTLSLQENLAGATGAVTFVGPVTVNGLTTFGQAYNVAFNGGATIGTATNFLNTGTVAFGDNVGTDTLVFTNGFATAGNATNPSLTRTASVWLLTANAPADVGPLTVAGNTGFNSGTGKTTFHNDIGNSAAGVFYVWSTGDIEFQSSVTVNGLVWLGGNLAAPPDRARIYKRDTDLGDLDLTITTNNNAFIMGQNQKLTVVGRNVPGDLGGSLTINAGTSVAWLSDLNAWGNITVTAAQIILQTRAPGGAVLQPDGITTKPDVGMDIVAGGQIWLNTPLVTLSGSGPLPRLSTPLPLNLIYPAGAPVVPVAIAGLLPPTKVNNAGSPLFGTPLDLVAGVAFQPPFLTSALPQFSALEMLEQGVALNPALRELLEQLGIFARDLTPDEQADMVRSASATYDDVVRKPEEEIEPQDYTMAASRLPDDLVKETVATYRGIFWPQGKYRAADLKALLQKAFDACKAKGSTDPAGFRKFLETTPEWAEALKLINDLKRLFAQIANLGLTGAQTRIAESILVRDIVPTGMTPEQLIATIKGVAPAAAAK